MWATNCVSFCWGKEVALCVLPSFSRWTTNLNNAEKLQKKLVRTNNKSSCFTLQSPCYQEHFFFLKYDCHFCFPFVKYSINKFICSVVYKSIYWYEVCDACSVCKLFKSVIHLSPSFYLLSIVFREKLHLKHWTAWQDSPRMGINTYQHMRGKV